MATVSFSSTGVSVVGFPTDDAVNTTIRVIEKCTIVNSEVVTIDHFTDSLLIRSVRVLVASTGADAASGASGVSSIVKTDANTTTITFGASAAGTYLIIIEI